MVDASTRWRWRVVTKCDACAARVNCSVCDAAAIGARNHFRVATATFAITVHWLQSLADETYNRIADCFIYIVLKFALSMRSTRHRRRMSCAPHHICAAPRSRCGIFAIARVVRGRTRAPVLIAHPILGRTCTRVPSEPPCTVEPNRQRYCRRDLSDEQRTACVLQSSVVVVVTHAHAGEYAGIIMVLGVS